MMSKNLRQNNWFLIFLVDTSELLYLIIYKVSHFLDYYEIFLFK